MYTTTTPSAAIREAALQEGNLARADHVHDQGLGQQADDEPARLEKRLPLGRVGETHEIVGPAVFLASDESRYVTGVELVIDGGLITR